ncbi:RHS repeat-associated core domain-containing protein [Aureibacter tunicatorum]|uniref:RHS repeat-associated protein n=1 Tax=Aureibacter tunicatorum TaxID=866807 RepID=A0AAE4BU74_9BACT|nr:RHS repeat-associated core domain-containing protein [Aureibacter tunicatorum]MDR6240478.1 RHS repeat-associated protein [Aureibacter tunicatorum]BDD05643.1 hypothetical protein AUTU_31260 [Aureibacter tunicatorum]
MKTRNYISIFLGFMAMLFISSMAVGQHQPIPQEIKVTSDGKEGVEPLKGQISIIDDLELNTIYPVFQDCEQEGPYFLGPKVYYDWGNLNTYQSQWTLSLQIEILDNSQAVIWNGELKLDGNKQKYQAQTFFQLKSFYCHEHPTFRVTSMELEGESPLQHIYLEWPLAKDHSQPMSNDANVETQSFSAPPAPTSVGTINISDQAKGEIQFVVPFLKDQGVYEYDIEWVHFYEEYTPSSPSTAFKAKEGFRATTKNELLTMKNIYPKGSRLFWRYRSVKYTGENNKHRETSVWTYPANNGVYINIGNDELIWQASSVFGEDGKNKQVISYYDQSRKKRQVATSLSTEGKILRGETFYDFGGRGTVTVMPVPSSGSLNYQADFNVFENSNSTSKSIKSRYDNGSKENDRLSTTSGASQYYSPMNNNDDGSIHNEYIPDAKGFAYTQMHLMNDATGRPMIKSGVGDIFRIDNEERTTRFIYANAQSEELYRLFGSNVGKAKFYSKTAVVDPNGQVSISYNDQVGKVVATSLAGDIPSHLDPLESAVQAQYEELTVALDAKNRLEDNEKNILESIINVAPSTLYEFDYELLGKGAFVGPFSCKECVYDLEIYVLKPDGNRQVFEDGRQEIKVQGLRAQDCQGDLQSLGDWEFSFIAQQVGEYIIVKKLAANKPSYQDIIDMITTDVDLNRDYVNIRTSINLDRSYCDECEGADCLEDGETIEGIVDETFEESAVAGCTNMLRKLWSEYTREQGLEYAMDTDDGDPDTDVYQERFDILSANGYDDRLCEYTLCMENSASTAWQNKLSLILDWGSSVNSIGGAIPGVYFDLQNNFSTLDPFFQIEGNDAYIGMMNDLLAKAFKVTVNGVEYSASLNEAYAYDGSFLPSSDKMFFKIQNGDIVKSNRSDADAFHLLYKDLVERYPSQSSEEYKAEIKRMRWTLYKSQYVEAKRQIIKQQAEDRSCDPANSTASQSDDFTPPENMTPEEIEEWINNLADDETLPWGDQVNWDGTTGTVTTQTDLHRVTEHNTETILAVLQDNCEPFRIGVFNEDQDALEDAEVISGHVRNYLAKGDNFFMILKLEDFVGDPENGVEPDADLWAINEILANDYGCPLADIIHEDAEECIEWRDYEGNVVDENESIVSNDLEIEIKNETNGLEYEFIGNDTKTLKYLLNRFRSNCLVNNNDAETYPRGKVHTTFSNYDKMSDNQLTENEKSILINFFNSIVGENNELNIPSEGYWALDNSLSEWYGIGISSSNKIGIQLSMLVDENYSPIKINLKGDLSSIKILEGISNLEFLNISHSNITQNIDFVFNHNGIKELVISNNENVKDMNFISLSSSLPSLEIVNLSASNISEFIYPNIPSLYWIDLSHNNISRLISQNNYDENLNSEIKLFLDKNKILNLEIINDFLYDLYVAKDLDFNISLSLINNKIKNTNGLNNLLRSIMNRNKRFHLNLDLSYNEIEEFEFLDNGGYTYTFKDELHINLRGNRIHKLINSFDFHKEHGVYADIAYNHLTFEDLNDYYFFNYPFKSNLLHYNDTKYDFTQYSVGKCGGMKINAKEQDNVRIYANIDNNLTLPDGYVIEYSWYKFLNPTDEVTIGRKSNLILLKKGVDPFLDINSVDQSDEGAYIFKINTKKIDASGGARANNGLEGQRGDTGYPPLELTSYVIRLSVSEQIYCTKYNDQNSTILLMGLTDEEITDLKEKKKEQCIRDLEEEEEYLRLEAERKFVEEIGGRLFENYIGNCIKNANEDFDYTYKPKEYHYTLYYYDQAGNLVQTVPPAGVNPITNQSQINQLVNADRPQDLGIHPAHELKTRYKYNSLNQLVWQNSPDGGETNFIYDSKSMLRFSQNAQQKEDRKASYSKYDRLGRKVESGEMWISGMTLADLQSYADDVDFPDDSYSKYYKRNTYYDLPVADLPEYRSWFSKFEQENLRNRVSLIVSTEQNSLFHPRDFNVGAAYYKSYTAYSYDVHGNVKSITQDFDLGKPKRTDYRYDLISGNVNYVFYQEGESDQFIHMYEYDADNRLTQVSTSIDGHVFSTEAKYIYYPHGPLARVVLGDEGTQVQGLDYYYTLQGWIKGVNMPKGSDPGNDGATDNTAKDAFAYELGYFNGDYEPIGDVSIANQDGNQWSAFQSTARNGSSNGLYNGNIAWMVTDLPEVGKRHENDDKSVQMMAYRYDQLNRIIASSSLQHTGNGQFSKQSKAYDTEYSYDPNGNIMTLNRYNYHGVLDNELVYNYYDGTNQLSSVTNGKYHVTTPDYNPLDHKIYNQGELPTQTDHVAKITATGSSYANSQGVYTKLKAGDYIDFAPDFNAAEGSNLEAYVEALEGTPKGLPDQEHENYVYDKIGNLIEDKSEGVTIDWTVQGKVKAIRKSDGTKLLFNYDATGNRVSKTKITLRSHKYLPSEVLPGMNPSRNYTGSVRNVYRHDMTRYYRDASGNVLATETQQSRYTWEAEYYNNDRGPSTLWGQEAYQYPDRESIAHTIYGGSSRLGEYTGGVASGTKELGHRQYELSNHLGNVLAVVSDKMSILDGEREAEVLSTSDYYPFGLQMIGRTFDSGGYRYGFNGKEKDQNGEWGSQTNYDYGFRIYNPVIAKFLSVDPLTADYPWFSPYHFAGNTPIMAIDIDGLETLVTINSDDFLRKLDLAIQDDLNVSRMSELVDLALKFCRPDDGFYSTTMYKGSEYAATAVPINNVEGLSVGDIRVQDNNGNHLFDVKYEKNHVIKQKIRDNTEAFGELFVKPLKFIGTVFNEYFNGIYEEGNGDVVSGGFHLYMDGGTGYTKMKSLSNEENKDVFELLNTLGYSKNIGGTVTSFDLAGFVNTNAVLKQEYDATVSKQLINYDVNYGVKFDTTYSGKSMYQTSTGKGWVMFYTLEDGKVTDSVWRWNIPHTQTATGPYLNEEPEL